VDFDHIDHPVAMRDGFSVAVQLLLDCRMGS
jgi:hypothetical protein